MNLKDAIAEAKSKAKQRKFVQSMDLTINFKNIDFEKQENKLDIELVLPKGRGKAQKIVLICGDELASKSKGLVDMVIPIKDLEKMATNKQLLKRIADQTSFFFAQIDAMPLVGKFLGQVLGPRGKMPKPIPTEADLTGPVARARNTIIIKTKGKNMPVIHAPFGTEEQADEDLEENALAVLEAIKAKLPQGKANIKSVLVKTTMGPAIVVTEGI